MIGDAGEHIGEPRFWVDVVETASRYDGEHDGGSIGPTLGTGEGPVAAPERNSSQRALGGIVRETNPAIFQEPGKPIPALQHVIDRLDHLGRFAERGALPFHSCMSSSSGLLFSCRAASRSSALKPLIWRSISNLPFYPTATSCTRSAREGKPQRMSVYPVESQTLPLFPSETDSPQRLQSAQDPKQRFSVDIAVHDHGDHWR